MILARLSQYQFYDPLEDRVMLRLQITEHKGTWYTDVPAHPDRTEPKVRERKAAFQTYVAQAMALGQQPKQVSV